MLQIPVVTGTIRRRILVNFRVDAHVADRLVPDLFRPKVVDGHAIAGICLIRLEHIRPKRLPSIVGVAAENAAHRIAVEWGDGRDVSSGVYIPRRDTGSLLYHWAGGALFPGEHHLARFNVVDNADRIDVSMASGEVAIRVRGRAASHWPSGSVFRSVDEASRFFETGSTGFSPRADGGLDAVRLQAYNWHVDPLDIDEVYSSYFADRSIFPKNAVEFDSALLMRDIAHEWQALAV